ncbi:hypothetical protein IMG5_157810, partial [Ichthyophthirius multifiliis]
LPKQSKLTQNFIKLPLKETPAVLPIESTNSPLGTGNIPADICKLKISAWNVNGLRAVLRRKDFQAYIENNNPDILCLNETKIDQEAFKKEKISSQIPPAYYQYWQISFQKILLFKYIQQIGISVNLHLRDILVQLYYQNSNLQVQKKIQIQKCIHKKVEYYKQNSRTFFQQQFTFQTQVMDLKDQIIGWVNLIEIFRIIQINQNQLKMQLFAVIQMQHICLLI